MPPIGNCRFPVGGKFYKKFSRISFQHDILINNLYRQRDRAGDTAIVVFVLHPHIQDNGFFNICHLFGPFLANLWQELSNSFTTESNEQQ